MPMNQGQIPLDAPLELHLKAAFDMDGTAHVRGVIRPPGESAPILVATQSGAQGACADSDGDGTAGLVRLEADFRDAESRERFHIVLIPTEHDVDSSGVYRVDLKIGVETFTGDVRFRAPQDRPRRG